MRVNEAEKALSTKKPCAKNPETLQSVLSCFMGQQNIRVAKMNNIFFQKWHDLGVVLGGCGTHLFPSATPSQTHHPIAVVLKGEGCSAPSPWPLLRSDVGNMAQKWPPTKRTLGGTGCYCRLGLEFSESSDICRSNRTKGRLYLQPRCTCPLCSLRSVFRLKKSMVH